MIKKVNKIEVISSLKVIIEHPYKRNGEVSMFVSKYLHENTYNFSIPYHDWTYEIESGKDICFACAPSGYNHPRNKERLIAAMNETIQILENN